MWCPVVLVDRKVVEVCGVPVAQNGVGVGVPVGREVIKVGGVPVV